MYILLKGKPSEGNVEQKWQVSLQAKSPNMSKMCFFIFLTLNVLWCVLSPYASCHAEQNLKDVLIGGNTGSSIRMIPLLLFSVETGSDRRWV